MFRVGNTKVQIAAKKTRSKRNGLRGPHPGRWCFGKTPMQTFLDAMLMTKEKMIAA